MPHDVPLLSRPDGRASRPPDARLRELRGSDEQWVVACPPGVPTATVVTGLLARCVIRLGAHRPRRAGVRALPVGERDWLLLNLAARTYGTPFETVHSCPACSSRCEAFFDLADVPVTPGTGPPRFRVGLPEPDGGTVEVAVRIPTGADQEAAATAADPAADLFARVVEGMRGTGVEDLAARLQGNWWPVEEAIERAAPRVELAMDLRCPACGQDFGDECDVPAYVLALIRAEAAGLLAEVHALAYYYHWSEHEILALPRPRRRAYLDLLTAEVEAVAGGTPWAM